ncbi:anthocyanidin 3-O-glucosyltransferase 2-like [Carica papaya]|uniref:anthocyanidin 3-O-glucosyltransferase 2-like n=1 Tax=Carica papaya TaxID=3649 RepID=UPI000B8C7E61|nr:anthocyanidin 3-O-glucosyltransferase 2-like [Carica papaya]
MDVTGTPFSMQTILKDDVSIFTKASTAIHQFLPFLSSTAPTRNQIPEYRKHFTGKELALERRTMKIELVFIPMPGVGHMVSIVEIAKLLLNRDERLSITLIIMKPQFNDSSIDFYIQSLNSSTVTDRISFIYLPVLDLSSSENKTERRSLFSYIEAHKPSVKEAVSNLALSGSHRLAGFVIDMFCTSMIDVADEFGVPSYLFYTSSASYLALELHLQSLYHDHGVDVTEFRDSDAEFLIPGFVNPLPAKAVLPGVMLDKFYLNLVMNNVRRYKRTKGIIVNSFMELESNVLNLFFDSKFPSLYPVGPILNLKGNSRDSKKTETEKFDDIIAWLDDQPPTSVVFLCFGSMGSFSENQVKEIADALEKSGHRFLWSLRQHPGKSKMSVPGEYENPAEVLPEGFLNRTAKMGKIIGWAPQVDVLGHPSIGGFVSHCGWNSTLESLWFGVPMAAWPLYAEQQFNAFMVVVELGVATEIKMDYRRDFLVGEEEEIVSAAVIEKGIRCLMEQDNEMRKKVMLLSETSRKALMDGGSSHAALAQFIQDVKDNMPSRDM